MKTALVILNWNGLDLLKKFIPKIILHSKEYADIYIIDNNSNDSSLNYIKENFKTINLIKHPQNYGFTKGYNEGLKQIDTDIFVLLNSDVETTENWLNPITKAFKKDKNLSICQPKILDYKNKNKFEYAGAAGGFIDKFGYPFCRGRIFNHLEIDQNQYSKNTEIFWATGACFVIRKKDFDELRGFDKTFIAHQEEIDLCWRAFNQNKKIKYIANSTVYHIGGATLSQQSSKKTFLNFRNSLFTLLKNAPQKQLMYLIFTRLFLDGITGIKFIFEGKINHCFAIVKSHFSFYKHFFKIYKKRTKHQRTDYYKTKSIVWQYFIKGKKTYKDL